MPPWSRPLNKRKVDTVTQQRQPRLTLMQAATAAHSHKFCTATPFATRCVTRCNTRCYAMSQADVNYSAQTNALAATAGAGTHQVDLQAPRYNTPHDAKDIGNPLGESRLAARPRQGNVPRGTLLALGRSTSHRLRDLPNALGGNHSQARTSQPGCGRRRRNSWPRTTTPLRRCTRLLSPREHSGPRGDDACGHAAPGVFTGG